MKRLLAPTLAMSALALGLQSVRADDQPAASTKAHDDNACVFSSTIYDWRRLDDTHLVLWAPNRNHAYLVTLSFPLQSLSSFSAAFEDSNHDGRICGFGMDRVILPNHGAPEASTIIGMKQLDSAALAQLSEQYKVKLLPKAKQRKANADSQAKP